MNNYFFTKSGVKIYLRWEDNIIVDPHLPPIQWKASQAKDRFIRGKVGFPKIASANSEDALSWNLFRALEKAGLLHALTSHFDFADSFRVLYWYRPFDRQEPEAEIQQTLDKIEPWGKSRARQQTETDITLRGNRYLLMIESKLGQPGRGVEAWNRRTRGPIPRDYEPWVRPLLVDPDSWEETLQRFYQLLRHLMLGCELARKWSLDPHLIAIVNALNRNRNGSSHEEEFARFRKAINILERVHLLTWQSLCREIAATDDAALQRLRNYLGEHPCLKAPVE